ncbi:MAG: hypothetical protein NZ951_05850 [Dehalococcoidia bacterium]|nr:hypothetical protein [Dehalococcoidia bacterium]MDW8119913.1 hypothetical protein [Chloroflexota bacterium]
MDIVVIGGGCYGTYHAGQLLKACRAGRLQARVIVVDRNPACRAVQRLTGDPHFAFICQEWEAFLRPWLWAPPPDAHLVPAPFTPHLALRWLAWAVQEVLAPSARVMAEPLPLQPPIPFVYHAPDGQTYVSYATWRCPPTCIEPDLCPHTRGARDWSLAPTLEAFAPSQEGVRQWCIFPVRHLAYGIATIPAPLFPQARDSLVQRFRQEGPVRALVATVSHCHGVVGVLRIERA